MTIRRGDSIIAGNAGGIPSQTGQSGKFLTTNGTMASWGDTVDYTNITNCITEIPQDIKLELNNGTLKLKAGSKAYVPNGFEADGTTPKFDVKIIESDIIVGSLYTDGPMFIYYVYVDNTVIPVPSSAQCSGTSNPIIDGYSCWYDTTNNIIKITFGDEVGYSDMSLPLAIVNGTSNGDWTSIDQVFNGFGYTGSTVFALPGVKGLIPNGRNSDGSLKNIEFTTSSVLTTQVTPNVVVGVRENAIGSSGNYSFDEINNQNLNSGAFWNVATIGDVIVSSGTITSFTPKTAFHAVDYVDYNKCIHDIDSKQDKSTAVNYNNISNCITYIPQDIKLELNNGTLTLKAGSKVYVPNGFESDGTTKKFDIIILNSDQTFSTGFNGNKVALFYGGHQRMSLDRIFSGDTMPSTTTNDNIWYDTSSNKIKTYKTSSSSWIPFETCSLPIGLATANTNGTGFTSIDQVFNGFGYIGSTIFALPGVKGLIPNGRNADGSLKNIEVVNDRVKTSTFPVGVTFTSINMGLTTDVVIDLNFLTYYEKENIIKNLQQSLVQEVNCATLDVNNSKITSFTPKTAFHALDYNDKSTISGWSIPNYNSGITLTFSKVFTNAGESKTMAKSGLFCFEFLVNNVISTIYFYVNNSFVGKIGNTKTSLAFWDEINFPVTKGDVVKVTAEINGGFTAAAVESYLFPYKGSMYE